jgi:organic radical activating enzyme
MMNHLGGFFPPTSSDRWLRITRADGTYDLKKFTKRVLEQEFDIKITAGSTMPVNRGAMLDLMIRMAQTPMPDGLNLVDREAVTQYLPEEVKASMLRRMGSNNQNLAEMQNAMQQMSQQMQQFMQQSQQNDNQTFQVIEDITNTLEKVNQQILQLQEKHDMIENERAEHWFIEEVLKLKGEKIDIAFFQVDPRLEENYDLGAEYFIYEIKPKLFVPMHFRENHGVTKKFSDKNREADTTVLEICKDGEELLV